MKKLLLLLIIAAFYTSAKAQTPGQAEKIVTDTICSCLSKVDVSKITSKQDAINIFTECFAKRTDLLMAVADEKHIDPTDQVAMRQLGIDIGKNLLKQNCDAFTKISVKMVQSTAQTEAGAGVSSGVLKRVDLKGFNYIVIADNSGSEKSFLWLRQFAGSEKLTVPVAQLAGKKLKITWQEIEVYLPQAKGYYKVKEITAVDFL